MTGLNSVDWKDNTCSLFGVLVALTETSEHTNKLETGAISGFQGNRDFSVYVPLKRKVSHYQCFVHS